VTIEMRRDGFARRLRSLAIVGMAIGAAATASPSAHAELGAIHPEVLRAAAAASQARGPEAYAALRELWRTWDRGDPTHVEEALRAFAESPSTSPPMRVYAELLSAYARRRRGDLDGAVAKITKLGFVSQWMTVGPFDNDNKGGFNTAFGPELEMDQPIVPTRTYDGKERSVKWRLSPEGAATLPIDDL